MRAPVASISLLSSNCKRAWRLIANPSADAPIGPPPHVPDLGQAPLHALARVRSGPSAPPLRRPRPDPSVPFPTHSSRAPSAELNVTWRRGASLSPPPPDSRAFFLTERYCLSSPVEAPSSAHASSTLPGPLPRRPGGAPVHTDGGSTCPSCGTIRCCTRRPPR